MRQNDHRNITKKVATMLAPQVDLALLITSSGEHPDLIREDEISHHSCGNLHNVFNRIRDARREFLNNSFSDSFQYSLGYAFHYIQDLMSISTPDKALRGRSKNLHDEIEAKFSRYSNYIASEGIKPESLNGEKEVTSFIKSQVEWVMGHPEEVFSNPEVSLERCFITCLSIAFAICRNESGFLKGDFIYKIFGETEQLLEQFNNLNAKMLKTCEQHVNYANYFLDKEKNLHREKRGFLFYFFDFISGEHSRRKGRIQSQAKSAIEKVYREIKGSEKETRGISAETINNIIRIETLLDNDYEIEYQKRQSEVSWYLFDSSKYKHAGEIRGRIKDIKTELERLQEDFIEKRKMIVGKE